MYLKFLTSVIIQLTQATNCYKQSQKPSIDSLTMVQTRSQADKATVEATFLEATDTTKTACAASVETITETIAALAFITTTPSSTLEQREPVMSATLAQEVAVSLPPSALPQEEDEEVFDPVTTIEAFCALVETVPVDQWKKRTAALDSLVATIVKEPTTPSLVAMAPSLSQLLKDPRSTVVKLTCASLKDLFSNNQQHHYSTNKNYSLLLETMFPDVLDIAALTSTVIRQQVQDMAVHALLHSSCPDVLIAILLHRLHATKLSKSKTVREACVLYLTTTLLEQHSMIEDNVLETVAHQLVSVLRDPTPSVLNQARKGLKVVRENRPPVWEHVVLHDEVGKSDLKLQTVLLKSLQEPTVSLEELFNTKASSVSKNRPKATSRGRAPGPSAISKFRNFQKQQQQGSSSSSSDENQAQNNTEITAPPARTGGVRVM